MARCGPVRDADCIRILGTQLGKPINFGPQHHYVVEAALWSLDRWIRTGRAAPKADRIKLTQIGRESDPPTIVLDSNGAAEGGIRTPWMDVPTATLSGSGNSGGQLAYHGSH